MRQVQPCNWHAFVDHPFDAFYRVVRRSHAAHKIWRLHDSKVRTFFNGNFDRIHFMALESICVTSIHHNSLTETEPVKTPIKPIWPIPATSVSGESEPSIFYVNGESVTSSMQVKISPFQCQSPHAGFLWMKLPFLLLFSVAQLSLNGDLFHEGRKARRLVNELGQWSEKFVISPKPLWKFCIKAEAFSIAASVVKASWEDKLPKERNTEVKLERFLKSCDSEQ